MCQIGTNMQKGTSQLTCASCAKPEEAPSPDEAMRTDGSDKEVR
ncbi:hypothetical protein Lalb_Chr22g0359141 [Lupinus albus]|uniref:Uncharacterized protein n=1 Tax=Lupinus albus TaxID=3870 RepID=A0A6A4N9T3_LUPAL|nr:hypothetical protein Lalb_Chr22g0359141 [Lupinus albus]